MPVNNRFTPALFYILAVLCNVFEVILMRLLGTKYTLSVESLIISRTIFECILVIPFLFYGEVFGAFVRCNQKRNIIISGLLLTCESFLWNSGIRHVPINDAFNISFIIPVMIVILSAIFLKERVTKKEISIISFCIIISAIYVHYQYQSIAVHNRDSYMYLIFATFFSSVGFIIKKKVSLTVAPIVIICYNILTFLVVYTLINIFSNNSVFANFDVHGNFFMMINAILHFTEIYLVCKAYSMSSLAKLQPLRFNKFLFSALFGYLFFQERLMIAQLCFFLLIFTANLSLYYKFRTRKNDVPKLF